MILISKTYQTFTPDSIEAGEAEETGYLFEDEPFTFRELLREITWQGFRNPSSSPATGNPREWLDTEPEPDYQTGEETVYSLHFSHNNPDRAAKYWKAAFRAANLIKG